jgi:hypothetical protein
MAHRPSSRPARWLTAGVLTLIAGAGAFFAAQTALASAELSPSSAGASDRSAEAAPTPAPSTLPVTATTTTTPTAPVTAPTAVLPATTAFASGNARLDALLTTLPPLLFQAGAHVHYGYNPIDCCHAGGYNPEPNDVWVGPSAFSTDARLKYVTVHELAHSVHLRSERASALTAAVSGAPVVRAGPWDDSEKVADCVAWALFPAETAASGITYWGCPEPYRSQVQAALR